MQTLAGVQALSDLNAQFGVANRITFETRFGGPVAVLTTPAAFAVVAIQGAQVLSYVLNGQPDVLWRSPLAQLGTGKAVRGGIPVCWPWFGPHPVDAARPAHGFVRAAPWRVESTASGPAYCEISFAFDASTTSLWEHRAMALLTVRVGDELKVSLETLNTGDSTILLTQALHTYLAVGDITKAAIKGLDERMFIDQLTGEQRRQAGDVTISGEVDRIYFGTIDRVTVRDPAQARAIGAGKSGSASTVIWNPWIAKSERLGDMGTDGYRHMVCVETCNAGPDVETLAPGGRHHISQSLRVLPL